MELDGRTALVTGATGGIGRAICARLAAAGADVAVHYHHRGDAARQLAAQLQAAGVRSQAYGADLAQPAAAARLVAEVDGALGLHVLVNNAAITLGGSTVADTAVDDWLRMVDVNLNAVFYLCRAAVPRLQARGGGSIVNVASNIVHSLPGGSSAYAATKSAVVAFTKVLSKEVARDGIRVNALSPGLIAVGMGQGAMERRNPEELARFLDSIPMGRAGQAEEVAEAVHFLVSDGASYLTGQNLTVNGGDRTESYQ